MGYDIRCVTNIESIPREHFCSFCQLLVIPKEALQSICGHLYCKPCLAYVASTTRACPYDGYLVMEKDAQPLAESNRVLAETIDKTVVCCLYQNSGCTWMGSLSASSSHCSGCTFGDSLVICTSCGTKIAHRHWQEHFSVCLEMHQVQMRAYMEARVAMATSQANAQGQGVAAATLTGEQWYQQPYQQYYKNAAGYYMPRQPLHLPSLAPQHQFNVAQTHSQMQAQSQLQNSQPQNIIGQYQSNQPHAYWTGQNIYPHPNQSNQVGASPNNMPVYHQVGTQTPQVQNHFPQQVSHLHPPQSLPTMENQHLPKPPLPQQHTTVPRTDVVHNQEPLMTSQVHQPITPVLGFQPQMNHHSASSSEVGSRQAAPSLSAVKEADMQSTQNQVSQTSWGQDKVVLNDLVWIQGVEAILEDSDARSTLSDLTNTGVNRAVEVTAIKFDHEYKGKRTDACVESLHRPSVILEENERKREPLSKEVMEENVGNGQKNLGKSLLVEKKGTESGRSLNGTPLLNPVLLEQDDVLRNLNILHQQYLWSAHLHSEDVQRSGAYSSGSLDSGFDQRSPVRPHEKHELDFEFRPASRFSQPSIELGEGSFRCGPRSLISEDLGMPSHGSGPLDHGLGGSREETTDTEGRFRFGLLRSDFKGHGNLQREKVQDADVIGPVDNHGLWPKDVGFSGDGGSFPGDLGSLLNSRKMVFGTVDGLNLHSQTREYQQKSMDMDVILQSANKLN